MKEFGLLVAGSRTFDNYQMLSSTLDKLLSNKQDSKIVIIEGEARGADTLAKKYAEEKGYEVRPFPADWNGWGKRAGYMRNVEMHDALAKYEDRGCVCFWDGQSKGTKHNFLLAYKRNTPIRIIRNGVYVEQEEYLEIAQAMYNEEVARFQASCRF